jgi:radical SAM superfamily enzyme YgiQ (UPF0313 family)
MLFIHPSAVPSSPHFMVMPMGVMSVMNELDCYQVEAINVGLELWLNKDFDLKTFLSQRDFDAVGIDLHWHEHAYSSLETARVCKEVNPDCRVILGGFTASYFAEEILAFCSDVDIVVSGEAEETVPYLLEGKELPSIPNVAYREDNHIRKTLVTPPSSLDDYDFSTITALHHWEEYLKCSIHTYSKTRFWYDFWLCTGRGCVYNCSYCGGAHSAQKHICGRNEMTFRSVDAVIRDLAYLQDLGVHVVCPSHDISLAGKKYWESLFTAMKKEEIYMGMYLEVWQLPDKDFVTALAAVCDPRFTTLAITLLSGSEPVREKNGKHFSNQQYYSLIHHVEENKMNHAPYFATGLPFETLKTFQKTVCMTEKLLSDFHPCAIFCTPLRLDPGSPMYEHPDQYGIVKHYHSFADYYERCKLRAENLPYDAVGYHTEVLDWKTITEMQNQWETIMRKNPIISGSSMDALHFL